MTRREEADQAKMRFAFGQSDHLTMLRAYNAWDSLSGEAKFDFCKANFLGIRTLQTIGGLKRQLLELLCDAGFVASPTPMRARAVESLGRREDGSDGVRLAIAGACMAQARTRTPCVDARARARPTRACPRRSQAS